MLCVERNLAALRAVEQHLAKGFGKFIVGGVHIHAVSRGQGVQKFCEMDAAALGPGGHRPLSQAQPRIRHHPLGIEGGGGSQAVAGRAGALGGVEREAGRCRARIGRGAAGAGRFLAEGPGPGRLLGVFQLVDLGLSAGDGEDQFEGVGQSLAYFRLDDQPVHHHGDIVGRPWVQGGDGLDVIDRSVDLDPGEPVLAQALQAFGQVSFAAGRQGGKEQDAASRRQRQDLVDHLVDGLADDGQVADRAVRDADPGVEQAQVVVNLRDGANGGSWIVTGAFLLDGDGWRQAFDQIHVRFVQALEELARIGGQRLDVAALAFGIEGVKGQGRLTAARESGDDDQSVAWQVKIDILQVVLAGTADRNHPGAARCFILVGHGPVVRVRIPEGHTAGIGPRHRLPCPGMPNSIFGFH